MSAFTETIKIACFGKYSSGKTVQIGNLIREYGRDNVGIVSCEHGLSTINSLLGDGPIQTPSSMAEFKHAWVWARDNFKGPDKWVCIDGGTRVLQWGSNDILQGTDEAYLQLAMGATRNDLSPTLKPWLRYISGDGNIDSRKQWMSIAYDADHEMNRWVKLECNHYWTFWEDETWINENKKGIPWTVDAPGKGSRNAIMGTFDFVLRLTREGAEGEKIIATHDPTGRMVLSKSRDDWKWLKMPTRQENFDLAQFVRTLKPAEVVK